MPPKVTSHPPLKVPLKTPIEYDDSAVYNNHKIQFILDYVRFINYTGSLIEICLSLGIVHDNLMEKVRFTVAKHSFYEMSTLNLLSDASDNT